MQNIKETTVAENNEPLEGAERPVPPTDPEGKEYCVAHPDTLAFRKCPVCGKYYCTRCLVHYFGTYYCDRCGAEHAPKQPEATRRRDQPTRSSNIPTDSQPLPSGYDESPKARRAFKLAIIGLIPGVGLVLDVIALVFAYGAFSELSEIRGLRGTAKAILATAISLLWFVVQVGAILVGLRYLRVGKFI